MSHHARPKTPTYDQLCAPELLRRAWRLVQQGGPAGGVDAVSLDEFRRRADSELQRIGDALSQRRYRFQPVRRTFIKKLSGGQRQLGIPTIADRVVAQAVRLVLERIAEPCLAATSFAYRPGRDVHQAIAELLRRRDGGQPWFLESDVADFFDSISHRRLLDLLGQRVRDGALLQIVRQQLEVGARLGRRFLATPRGVAQGSPLSPLLSNLYLDPFDRARLGGGCALVRYADDFVICCRSREEAEQARRRAVRELGRLELRVNGAKTRILDARRESLEFLGFLLHPGYLWPAPGNVQRFRVPGGLDKTAPQTQYCPQVRQGLLHPRPKKTGCGNQAGRTTLAHSAGPFSVEEHRSVSFTCRAGTGTACARWRGCRRLALRAMSHGLASGPSATA